MNSFQVSNYPIDKVGTYNETCPELTHLTLEWLFKAHINQPDKRGTSSWDVQNLDTKILNSVYDFWQQEAIIGIKENDGGGVG